MNNFLGNINKFGSPSFVRENEMQNALKNVSEYFPLEYMGQYRSLPVIEMRIETPIYRLENIRTVNLQKEYIVTHKEKPVDIFSSVPESIEAQETQHILLKKLISEEKLYDTFKKENLHQTEPLICTINGIIVNGNRRLCAWRELFYSDQVKFKHLQTVKLAVLPNNDPQGIHELEVRLQITTTMKAEYTWHAIATMVKKEAEKGIKFSEIALSIKKTSKDVQMYIDCHDYAEEYLKRIERPDEWTLVDKMDYAFQQIVKSRKKIYEAGKKSLFEEVAFEVISVPAKDGRLYDLIPDIATNINIISEKFAEKYNICADDEGDSDIGLLGGNEQGNNFMLMTETLKRQNDPNFVIDTVKKVIDAQTELSKEKKSQKFVLEQVSKAATALTYVIQNLDDTMSKDGVKKQIETIELDIDCLKNWLK